MKAIVLPLLLVFFFSVVHVQWQFKTTRKQLFDAMVRLRWWSQNRRKALELYGVPIAVRP